MHRTRERRSLECFALGVIDRKGNPNFCRESSDTPHRCLRHFLFHMGGGTAEIDPVALGVDAHDREHARAKRGRAQVGGRKRFPLAVIIDRRIGDESAARWAVLCRSPKAAHVFDVDMNAHGHLFAARWQ